MSSQCPQCAQPIEIKPEDFGTLFRCKYCHAEFFVGFDGNPENSKEVSAEEGSSVPLESSPLQTSEVIPSEFAIPDAVLPEASPTVGFENQFVSATNNPFEFQQELAPKSEPEPQPQPILTSPQPLLSPINDFSAFPENSTVNFNDVTEFANNTTVPPGAQFLDLTIGGIDLAEIKSMVIEVLDDQRIGLNVEEIKSKISDGKIHILNLPIAKAIYIVQRLQTVDVDISWSENESN